ncbi:MAG: phosphodiesterase [Clostridia bacterium]|nr:phosphodiesterase [Clostridia bacterium]
MKYLVASDIHGSSYYAKKLLEKIKNESIDKIILLGDIYYHGPRNPLPYEYNPKLVSELLNQISDKIIAVKGNCDSEVDQMVSDFKIENHFEKEIFGKKFFFTHGHIYNKDSLPLNDFDFLVYGHFHTGFILEKDNKIFVNPGSTTLPKEKTENSYLVIDEKEKTLKIKNFDDKILYQM